MADVDSTTFIDLLARLHAQKNAGYGDAWRRRGELLSIFTNLARKYDRLVVALGQGANGTDERNIDTAGDLCVYAAKYLTWLAERSPEDFDAVSIPSAEDCADRGGANEVNLVLRSIEAPTEGVAQNWAAVKSAFVPLEVGLIAQGEGDKGGLGWQRKTALTWELASSSFGLLMALGAKDPGEVEMWRDEIEAMG